MPADHPTALEAYASIQRHEIGPRLRALGFTGSAGSYVLPDDEWWRVVAFQKDRYSRRDWVRFTVNLTLTAKDEWAMQAARSNRPRRHPGAAVEMVGYHIRLGNLMPPLGEDRWWEIGAEPLGETGSLAEAALAGREVIEALNKFAVPWLLGGPDPYFPALGRGRRPQASRVTLSNAD
jgi:hypothetical protein